MKHIDRLAGILLALGLIVSCSEDVQKYDNWPEWETKATVTVAGQEMTETYYTSFSGTRLALTEGQEVDFTGIDKLKYALQNQYWEVVSDSKARFKGADGEYDLIYDGINSLLYTEQPEVEYPDALYVIGEQLGHPGATEAISKGWSIDTPDNAQSCRKVSEDKFEISLYLATGFKLKFFRHRGWGDHGVIEIWAEDVRLNQPTLVSGTGDFCAGPLFQPGVYTLIINLSDKTFDAQSQIPVEEEVFSVNGNRMTPSGAYMHAQVELENGKEVVFGNFGGISDMVQPEFYNVTSDVEGKAEFLGVSGTYDIYLDVSSMLVYTESAGMNLDNAQAMWVTGAGFGHPKAGRVTVGDWKLTEPLGSFQLVKVEDGVYETSMYLADGFDVKFYKGRDWGAAYSTEVMDPLPSDLFMKGISGTTEHCVFTGDLLPGADFSPGVYRVRADVHNKIVYAVDRLSEEDIHPVEYKVNGAVMTDSRYGNGFKEVTVNMEQGAAVSFENIQRIDYMLQPEYFVKQDDGSYVWGAVSGEYRILYDADVTEYIWAERTSNEGLWITGQYFGHPKFGGWGAGDPNNSPYLSPAWNWDNPKQYLCCAETEPGIYETSFIFHSSWSQFTLYGDRGWSNTIRSSDVTITDISAFGRSYYWNDGVGNDTNFGCTVANIGEQYGVFRLKIDMNSNPIVVEPTIIDGFGHF